MLDTLKFTAEQFKPTKSATAADKAKFGNHFLAFVAKGFPKHMFTQAFYEKLANCFGHIAHYDREGFWAAHFYTDIDKIEFIKLTLSYPCWGQPEFTFCDVEGAINTRIQEHGILAAMEDHQAKRRVPYEKAELARLQAKYGQPETVAQATT